MQRAIITPATEGSADQNNLNDPMHRFGEESDQRRNPTSDANRPSLDVRLDQGPPMLLDGTRIKALRNAAGLTQDALAARAELSGGYISLIERDLREVSSNAAQRLALALNVQASSLLRPHSSSAPLRKPPPSTVPPGLATVTRRLEETAERLEQVDATIASDVRNELSRFRQQLRSASRRPIEAVQNPALDGSIAYLQEVKRIVIEADRARDRGDYLGAEEQYSRARRLLDADGATSNVLSEDVVLPVTIEILLGLTAAAYHLGRIREAYGYAEEGLQWCSDNPGLLPAHVRFLIWAAEIYDLTGHAERAERFLRQADEFLRSEAWPSDKSRAFLAASVLRVRGAVMMRCAKGRADWVTAARLFDESIAVASAGARTGQLRASTLIALEAYAERDQCRLCIRQGDLVPALAHAERSYLLRQELRHGPRATAHYYAHIADVYRSISDDVDEELRNALFDALDGFEEISDDLDVARMCLRLARLYRKDGRPRDARYWAERSRTFGQRAELPLYQALAERQLGLAWALEGDLPAAEKHLRKSLSLLGHLQDGFEHAVSQRALGGVLARRWRTTGSEHDREEAWNLLEDAWALFDALGARIEREKARLAQELVMPEEHLSNEHGDSVRPLPGAEVRPSLPFVLKQVA